MPIPKGSRRTWKAGRQKIADGKALSILIPSTDADYLKQRYGSIAGGIREVVARDRRQYEQHEARKAERQQKQQAAKS